jgi:hypothetical protein
MSMAYPGRAPEEGDRDRVELQGGAYVIVNKRIVCLLWIAILTTMLGQGCTIIGTSDRSEMQLPTSTNSRKLALDSVTIGIVPLNNRVFAVGGFLVPVFPIWESYAKTNKAQFWFLVVLSPENGEISFDPKRVVLETDHGDTFLAAGFSGPLLVADAIRDKLDLDKHLLNANSLNASLSPFSISAEVFVGVMFNTKTLDPDQHFTVFLKGLERQGLPIEVPSLKFKNEKRRLFAFLTFDPLNIRKEWIVNEQ